jgi:hypothetical protein
MVVRLPAADIVITCRCGEEVEIQGIVATDRAYAMADAESRTVNGFSAAKR